MDLTAHWIWDRTAGSERNVVVQFRRAFALAAAPAQARLHLSADTRYLLYVNGARLGYGPARSYHSHYEFDTYDIASHLHAGRNVLAVAVLHWGEGTFHQVVGRGGLLAQLELDGQPSLATDTTWRARRCAAYQQAVPRISCQMAWEEQFDARLDDSGWTGLDFDDRAWEPARSLGPHGCTPWGTLSPRTIPFLTDEPLTPQGALSLGEFRRPELVLALHAGPYLAPGDLSANRQDVDALFASVLVAPTAGAVTLKRCMVAGGDPPTGETLRFFLDGTQVEWQPAACDYAAAAQLSPGEHVLLIDWHGKTHDMDLTLTASGLPGLRAESPLPAHDTPWVVATAPAEARAAALATRTAAELRASAARWQHVDQLDAPAVDVYMDMTASVPLAAAEQPASLPMRVPPAADGCARHYVFDIGRLGIGWLEIELEAPAGAVVDLLGYEAEQDGLPQMTQYMNNTLRYTCRAGRQRYVSVVRRGLRYVLCAVHGHSAPVVIHHVGLRLATYPWDIHGAFRSSDERLNKIWELCAYTLRLCSEDTFTDCPTYEQTLWTGDACHADVLVQQAVHGDPRLSRRCLLLVAQSLERLPLAGAQVPGDWENDLLPNWSFLWAVGCANFYHFTGDDAFAREIYPALAKQAAYVVSHRNEAGLFAAPGLWHLLDWADMPREPNDVVPHESCLAVAALHATASLALVAGREADAAPWRQAAAELAEAVNRECWHPTRHAYTDLWQPGAQDDHISQPTNSMALLAGVAQGQRAAAILPHLLHAPPGWEPHGTPWMYATAADLLAEHGHVTEVLSGLRERWGAMLDRGATTAWETFPGFQPGWWTRSWCHAWSALPAYLLSAYVLGVRPLTPGFGRALIAPQLGDLAWAEGRMPTPHGAISVRAEQNAAGLNVHVGLPPNVTADVRLPAGSRPLILTGDAAIIERLGDAYSVALPAGAQASILAPP